MKTKAKLLPLTFLLGLTIILTSCSKDDPVPELDQEVITDVTLTFTEVDESGLSIGSSMDFVASSEGGLSLDGNLDIETIIGLESGKSYRMEITAYNGIADEDITEEIEEEADEHQFYFLGSAFVGENSFMEYAYDDTDTNGNPIGLNGIVKVDENLVSNSGKIRIVLRHDLDKSFTGADNPHWENYVQAGGESDLDLSFEVTF
ncbi:hypothetical protein KZP23_19965 [Echinicola marina]|uniref:hypothetical protein n=1 Tax=Echinicola marina TaxID=2859768 RepID=UPI001CF6842F|nr:hypothetical protein [Echinicola marina]UCS92917.1 hypothetical protein KZP23_19965 [Echinicola marina]